MSSGRRHLGVDGGLAGPGKAYPLLRTTTGRKAVRAKGSTLVRRIGLESRK